MAKAYQEGAGWAIRRRYKNTEIYLSGYKTKAEVEKAAGNRITEIDRHGEPAGSGPGRTTLAQALQDYALVRLPFKKGAKQEAVRMNHYLRAAGLDTLVTVKVEREEKDDISGSGRYFEVRLEPHTEVRKIPNGLAAHRKAQMTKTADARKHRSVLATTAMEKVTRQQVQAYLDAMRAEGSAPATLAQERALIRSIFNYAKSTWRWASLTDNPGTALKMPAIHNERERVMSNEEQVRLDLAFADCKNALVVPVTTLLRETAMRSSEALQTARWCDVDWDAKLLRLQDSKSGRRNVPLSPVALQALRDIGPGEPDDLIVQITYESLRASWNRACKRADIEKLNIHDLRHTAATRMALKTGNLFIVKALTGHKTFAMVERYANVKAEDVVDVMHAPAPDVLGMVADAKEAALSAEQLQMIVQSAVAGALAARQASA